MSEQLFDIFAGMPGRSRAFAKDETLFIQGDPVASVFVLRDGAVKLVRRDDEGRSLVLHTARAGSLLAEASMFAPKYHCDGVCVTDGEAWMVPIARVRAALSGNAELASVVAARLAHEVQSARARAEILFLKTVAERLDGWLAHHGAMPEKGDWHRLADEIGVSPEALYRELARRRTTKRK